MEYDSSAFWSVLNPVMRLYRRVVPGGPVHDGFGEASKGLPRHIYYPSKATWTKPGPARPLVEIPLPRTRRANLPFYSNFHLATGALYRAMAVGRMNQPYFVYLVHLVEFTDLSDGLPAELGVHPNVRTAATVKIRALAETIGRITARYRIVTSSDAVRDFKAGAAGATRHAVGTV